MVRQVVPLEEGKFDFEAYLESLRRGEYLSGIELLELSVACLRKVRRLLT